MKCDRCRRVIGNFDDSFNTSHWGEICSSCVVPVIDYECEENTKLRAEVERLREELRWRRWPEEKPETKGKYLVSTDGSTSIGEHVSYYSQSIGWATKDAGIAWWRPIGELPKEKTEAGGADHARKS